MKKIILTLFFLMTIVTFTDCESDDALKNETPPELLNFVTEISSFPNYEIKFRGTINEDIGIATIQISYPEWFLNKTIVFDNKIDKYILDYKFLVPKDALVGSAHLIKIKVTDKAGNDVAINVKVTLNLDIINPAVQFVSPANGITHVIGNPLTVNVNASDDRSLKSLRVKSDVLNLDTTINFSAGETAHNYLQQIQIPAGVLGNVTINATVTDMNNNVSTASTTILVSVTQVFAQMFLVGGSTWYGWNAARATKMWQSPQNNQVFVAEFYYRAGMGVKFIGQLGSSPNNWGLNPNNNSQIINSPNSLEINFPTGDGYYRIEFNPYQQVYNFQMMTINVAERSTMFLMGKGFVGHSLNWSPANAIPMIKSTSNPYVFSVDIQFSNEVDLKYIGQNNGWGPYDAGFVEGGQKQVPINYVKGATGSGTSDIKFTNQAGSYRIIYDYFLLRTTIQPL